MEDEQTMEASLATYKTQVSCIIITIRFENNIFTSASKMSD